MSRLSTLTECPQPGIEIDDLLRTEAYPDRTTQVELIETHISWVFLTDRFAYKLKKPVKFDFLDFSSIARRQTACENEVRLNLRLAPNVYLGVVPLTRLPSGRLVIDGKGEVVDWLVRMRRLPADRAMDVLIRRQTLTDSDVAQISDKLSQFYGQLAPITLQTDSYRRQIEDRVLHNRTALLDCQLLQSHVIRRVHSSQLRLLHLQPQLFDNRVRDGRIVEGHGDLRPEHIYLLPTPAIIDCIEFCHEFRQIDVLDELAFLAVECSYLGETNTGCRILEHYCETSGDRASIELLSFYMSYRACVRAKVHALRALQLLDEPRDEQVTIAADYLALADFYAGGQRAPLLIVARGVSGVGKSTFAAALAESLGMEHLQTDQIRQEIFAADQQAEDDHNKYSAKSREAVYQEMFKRADALLKDRLSVVLDGTFLEADLRRLARRLAEKNNGTMIVFRCHCPRQIAEERIVDRSAANPISEAIPQLVQKQLRLEEADPLGMVSCSIDTTASFPSMLETAYSHLRAAVAESM